jgi:EAL domain-containing protein (putative c-di-GMP-specific phosphodiesterase class I)
MREGKVVGAEALIRWNHPEEGLLLPGRYMPLVENSDLSAELGRWVLRQALGQMSAWADAGRPMPVSVNISGRHLQQADFVDNLAAMLAEYPGIDPRWLELEILETAALEDMAAVSVLVEGCDRLGVRFALDDFGTGYSSLTYLRHLPVHLLKIDRSFVRDMLEDAEDLAIVEGVIGLATAFRREVIAEGVETVEHGTLLMRLGCDLAQGFGIAAPMPAKALPAWLESWRQPQAWTTVAEYSWSRDDVPLLTVETDHRRWIDMVIQQIGRSDGIPPAIQTLENCRFGLWLNGPGRYRYGQRKTFRRLVELHEQVHAIAEELLARQGAGDDEGARAGLERLLESRDRLITVLHQLQNQVARKRAELVE